MVIFICKSYVTLSIRYIPRNSINLPIELLGIKQIDCYIPKDSTGFTDRIPKYITGRQNYIGFTYNLPITYLY